MGLNFFPRTALFAGSTLALSTLPEIDPAVHSSAAIDSRIAGRAANAASENLFSTLDHATPAYVRSTTCWAADIDMTAAVVWHSSYATFADIGGTAITPRQVELAYHTTLAGGPGFIKPGDTMRFVGADNQVVTRTILAIDRVGATDICIAKLDSDLPPTITPARVLPKDYAAFTKLFNSEALLVTDKTRSAFVMDFSHVDGVNQLFIAEPLDAQRLAFEHVAIAGDSGSGIFLVIDRAPVLLAHLASSVEGIWLTAYYDAVNAVLAAQGTGYQLTPAPMPRASRHAFHIRGTTNDIVENFCEITNDYYGYVLSLVGIGAGLNILTGNGAECLNLSRTGGGSQALIKTFNLATGAQSQWSGDGAPQPAGYTVATLPNAAANIRGLIYVSNESGGAVLAFSDGANWRRVTDRAIVS